MSEINTIDALFSSKTRVKLLHLFLNNPEKSFYVREITRLIDEQINSVRRELANMLSVGIIVSDSAENKLYYAANPKYEHFAPFRQIFAGVAEGSGAKTKKAGSKGSLPWRGDIEKLPGVRVAIVAGALVRGSASPIDLLLVGSMPVTKAKAVIKKIEKLEGRELQYTMMTFDDFYYRMSVRDKFVMEIINSSYSVLVDTDNLLSKED